jgi:hypothetical protein
MGRVEEKVRGGAHETCREEECGGDWLRDAEKRYK